MNLLAIETSSNACSVALLKGETITVSHEVAPMQQTKQILPVIQKLLADAAITLKDLDAIAFGCGPGSFTGVRIASSVTQALAFVEKLPIISISSLAAIAQSAWLEQQYPQSLVALDARMNQVYWAAYTINEQGLAVLQDEEQVCLPQEIKVSQSGIWYGVGDGWEKYQEQLVSQLTFEPKAINIKQLPTAEGVLILAKHKFERGEWVEPAGALPVYLR
ncbi:MAG: tRNA (adenosine(37)-N6)-threonylcarbamoyltransferase complex dimerization subunit type 1 TsaB [Gammaproteobacteria bacterium]